MPENLRPEGIPVVVGDVVLTTPGLSGVADVYESGGPGMRGAEDATQAFLDALDQAGMAEQLTVEITDQSELDGSGGTRGGGDGTQIELEVPAPGEGNGQVVLYAAEDGTLSWHYPDDVDPRDVPSRGGERRTYRIPREVVVQDPGEGGQRGILGAVGSKLFKVVVFPLIDPILGKVGNHFAAKWEEHHRPRTIRSFTIEGYRQAVVPALTDDEWAELRKGPALLFVHGTFSTSQSAFAALPPDVVSELHRRYEGRVIALDHHSVSVTPRDNGSWLASALPDGSPLTVDVVTHSRGGLVGRAFAERAGDLGLEGKMVVRNLVMVAPPNAGTPLADEQYLSTLLDRVTNLVQFLPGAGITDVVGMVLTVVKQLTVGAFAGLEGIMSMNPVGPDLASFNDSPGATSTYRVIAADYEPPDKSSLARIARNKGMDLVFKEVKNDLVVPTAGCYDLPHTAGFPVANPFVLPASAGINHNDYFGHPEVTAKLLEWLPGA